ncbi:MAG: hypothetical protein QOH35_357 [Acidobacteriaceae bacterium]|jgi:hypothetical protein|nr:hypothetical protein [Acidobacteriaceae bacterium]
MRSSIRSSFKWSFCRLSMGQMYAYFRFYAGHSEAACIAADFRKMMTMSNAF